MAFFDLGSPFDTNPAEHPVFRSEQYARWVGDTKATGSVAVEAAMQPEAAVVEVPQASAIAGYCGARALELASADS